MSDLISILKSFLKSICCKPARIKIKNKSHLLMYIEIKTKVIEFLTYIYVPV